MILGQTTSKGWPLYYNWDEIYEDFKSKVKIECYEGQISDEFYDNQILFSIGAKKPKLWTYSQVKFMNCDRTSLFLFCDAASCLERL